MIKILGSDNIVKDSDDLRAEEEIVLLEDAVKLGEENLACRCQLGVADNMVL